MSNTNTDIVAASIQNPVWKSVNTFHFNHIFARIGMCDVIEPSGFAGDNLSVTISPKTSGTYSISDSTWVQTGNPGNAIQLATEFGDDTDYDVYLVPGVYTINASYTLSKGEGAGCYVEEVNATATIELKMGVVNNIIGIIPPGDASSIEFSVSVNPWVEEDIDAMFEP